MHSLHRGNKQAPFPQLFPLLYFQLSWQQRKTRSKEFTLRLPVCAIHPLVMYADLRNVADVKSLHLPDILKPGFRGTLRRLYAVVSIGDSRYEMSSLDSEAYATRPMTLWAVSPSNRSNRIHLILSSLSKPSAKLSIELFAKRSRHDDILLAQAQVQVNRFGDDEYSEGWFMP